MRVTGVESAPVEKIFQDPDAQRAFLDEREEMRRFFESLERQLQEAVSQPPTTEPHSPRELELRWLAAHPEVLTEYAGQWIALEGAALIAADPKLSVVMETARAQGILRPLTLFIPSDPRDYWLGFSNQPIS